MNIYDLMQYEEEERHRRWRLWFGEPDARKCPICGHPFHAGRRCGVLVPGDHPHYPVNFREPCDCCGAPTCPECGKVEAEIGPQSYRVLECIMYECQTPGCLREGLTHSVVVSRKEGA